MFMERFKLLNSYLSLVSLAVISLSFVLIIFGQVIAFGAVSAVLTISGMKLGVLDIVFWLQYIPFLGLIPQGIGAGLLAFFLLRSEGKVDTTKTKKQFLRLSVILVIGAVFVGSALVTVPVVHANLVASANYYLDNPIPLDRMYVGENRRSYIFYD